MTVVSGYTHSTARKRMFDIHARQEALRSKHRMSKDDEAEFSELSDEFNDLNEFCERMEVRQDMADNFRGSGGGRIYLERGAAGDYDADPVGEPRSAEDPGRRFKNPWDLSQLRTFGAPHEVAAELRGRALSAIEKMPGASDAVRKGATHIIERFDDRNGRLAQFCLVTSSPAYTRAWSKLATGQGNLLSPEEIAAVDQSRQLARAMSLTDTAGGFLAPFQIDPTVISSSAGVYSDIRSLARVVVATSDVWHGVSAANVSWSFDAEGAEVSDDSPDFAGPEIPNYTARGFVPISIEALADEQNVTQAVGELFMGGKQDLEGTKFILGSGIGEPTGLITALVASSPSVIVNSQTTDTFALADVYRLQGALPARWRQRASWLANNLFYNMTRQFDTAGGNGLWAQLGDGRPPVLLGRQVAEAEAMDGTINASAENYAMVFGDFGQYTITDRLGFTVELIPHLFGANRRPTGQRGWFAWYRTGADVLVDGAFRLLNVT
jgi:HK97 family phage major capsid protein